MSSIGYHAISLPEAVIKQAWEDAFDTPCDRLCVYDVDEAWAFLTSQVGRWYQSRVDWCVAAGLCPDKLRTNALKRILDYERQRRLVKAGAQRKSAYSKKYELRAKARRNQESA